MLSIDRFWAFWAASRDAIAAAIETRTLDAWTEAITDVTLLAGKTADGLPVSIIANLAIKRIDHLLMDLHMEVEAKAEGPFTDGLPTGEEGPEALVAPADCRARSCRL